MNVAAVTTQSSDLMVSFVLIVSSISFLVLLMLLIRGRILQKPDARLQRARQGLHLIVAVQALYLLLLICLALKWIPDNPWRIFLPYLVTTITLIGSAWIWLFPRKTPAGDTVTAFFMAGTLVLMSATLLLAASSTQEILNWLRLGWNAFYIALAGIALLVLVARRLHAWKFGLAMLVLLLISAFAEILSTLQYLIPFPYLILAGIVTSVLWIGLLREESPREPTSAQDALKYIKSAAAKPRLMDLEAVSCWMNCLRASNVVSRNQLLVKAVAMTVRTDLACILHLDEERESIFLEAGYDLLREREVGSVKLTANLFPELVALLKKQQPYQGNADEIQSLPWISTLKQRLSLEHIQSVMLLPLDSLPEAGFSHLLLLSVFLPHEWTRNDRNSLQSLIRHLASGLQPPAAGLEISPGIASHPSPDADAKNLYPLGDEVFQHILQENRRLKSALASLEKQPTFREERDHLESELRLTLEELARLQNALAEANMKILALEEVSFIDQPDENQESNTLEMVAKELRPPLKTIQGYLDILSSESVGLLGTVQMKFLERIRLSINHLEAIIDSLIPPVEEMDISRRWIDSGADITPSINQVLGAASAEIDQKQLTIHNESWNNLPHLRIDPVEFAELFSRLFSIFIASTREGQVIYLKSAATNHDPAGSGFCLHISNYSDPELWPDRPLQPDGKIVLPHSLTAYGVELSRIQQSLQRMKCRFHVASEGRNNCFRIHFPQDIIERPS